MHLYFPWISLSENSKPVMHNELKEWDSGQVSVDHPDRSQVQASLGCMKQADGAGMHTWPGAVGSRESFCSDSRRVTQRQGKKKRLHFLTPKWQE